jgi:hypothetical protein
MEVVQKTSHEAKEEEMPPKMRKKWMHDAFKGLMLMKGREGIDVGTSEGANAMDVDGASPSNVDPWSS